MQYSLITLVLATIASASPFTLDERASSPPFDGVATFNDYVDQVKNRNQPTVCGPYNDEGNIFAAAAGDLSPDISNGRCDYDDQENRQDRSLCTVDKSSTSGLFQQPNSSTYQGPSCPAACGNCYKVLNKDSNKSVTVKIVDACPALSAYNYCKSDIEPAGKCSGPKNALDISVHAYPFLVNNGEGKGQTGSTTNLNNLSITPLKSCSG